LLFGPLIGYRVTGNHPHHGTGLVKVSIRQIIGNWDLGYVLDKHALSSIYLGDNEYGRPQFDTTRSEAGEALFRLKYRSDWTQVDPLANELASSIYPKFADVGLLIPMPASNVRPRQPVTVLTEALGKIVDRPVFDDLLIKKPGGQQLKDIVIKAEKVEALKNSLSVNDTIEGAGLWNALLLDDLFDTGASLEAACAVLRAYPRIEKIYVAALTWK
jgi:predicted amidophosphoribosyltransferase